MWQPTLPRPEGSERWSMGSNGDVDVTVVGSGPHGLAAADVRVERRLLEQAPRLRLS